eukprot:10812886-Alexandrium_andersonii.AAC.1
MAGAYARPGLSPAASGRTLPLPAAAASCLAGRALPPPLRTEHRSSSACRPGVASRAAALRRVPQLACSRSPPPVVGTTACRRPASL